MLKKNGKHKLLLLCSAFLLAGVCGHSSASMGVGGGNISISTKEINLNDIKHGMRDLVSSKDNLDVEIMVELENLKNRNRRAEIFDIRWQIGRAIDNGFDLSGFIEFGLTPAENGAYHIDLKDRPFWQTLDEMLISLRSSYKREYLIKGLTKRGFRNEDILLLESYVEETDPSDEISKKNKTVLMSASKKIKNKGSSKKGKKDIIRNFIYERSFNNAMMNFDWSIGLMQLFDNQRQRILISYLLGRNGSMSIHPSNLDDNFAALESILLLDEKEITQLVEKERADRGRRAKQ